MNLLCPKKLNYKKYHRGRLTKKVIKNITLHNGEYGLQILKSVWITAVQLSTIKRIITKYIKKKIGKYWINAFPDKPITMRVAESRMGSGKGNVKYWVAVVKCNTILVELKNIPKELALKILKSISYKLPVKTKIIL